MGLWAALALTLAFVVLGPAMARADGATITIAPSPDGVYVVGSSLTASFSTDGALNGNTPLSVRFVSSAGGAAIPSTYTILSAAGTTYTASITIPDLAPGEYTLVIEGPEINGDNLTSDPITILAPTVTPLPVSASVPIGAQPHVVPSSPAVSGGIIAVAAAVVAGGLLLMSLALLIVPPLRRRGNQPLR